MGYSMRTPEWRYTEWAEFPDCLLKSGVLMRESSEIELRGDLLPDGELCDVDAECASGYCFRNLLGQQTCAPRPTEACRNPWGPAMPCEESPDPRWDKVYGVELYSHHGDKANSFGEYELVNLAYQAEYQQTVLQLRAELHEHWA